MASVALTNDVCSRLENPADHCVLVTRPIVQVTTIEELEDREIGGFQAKYRVTLTDGNGGESQVVVPLGADIGANAVADGAVIKIEQMVRIPHGSNKSVVVVHSAEVVTEDFALKLTDMDRIICQLRERLQLEKARRGEAEQRLQALLPANLGGLSPETLIDLVLEALSQVFQVATEAIV